jgi:tRNA threonylcarbamoyladenosine biosynthesis protein TsaE
LRFRSPSAEQTAAAARLLASVLDDRGLVVSLIGDLGVGKTVFVKGLAEGLGIDPAGVASPTFVLCSEYPTPAGHGLAHIDFYRVEQVGEIEAMGFVDLLEPGAVVAVEWGDRFSEVLPPDHLKIEILRPDPFTDPARRDLHALSCGPVSSAALARWTDTLDPCEVRIDDRN